MNNMKIKITLNGRPEFEREVDCVNYNGNYVVVMWTEFLEDGRSRSIERAYPAEAVHQVDCEYEAYVPLAIDEPVTVTEGTFNESNS